MSGVSPPWPRLADRRGGGLSLCRCPQALLPLAEPLVGLRAMRGRTLRQSALARGGDFGVALEAVGRSGPPRAPRGLGHSTTFGSAAAAAAAFYSWSSSLRTVTSWALVSSEVPSETFALVESGRVTDALGPSGSFSSRQPFASLHGVQRRVGFRVAGPPLGVQCAVGDAARRVWHVPD
ncbi:unnamed protein product [Prorocentrum cordatum]|uniref:Uncharacterized protein n=1 Tax=Prorocentrum cordatum TaxID=2364126 RepID=A0ABN9TGZ5_9DINO|nr:unnamed protein product [Polarella glacialis]